MLVTSESRQDRRRSAATRALWSPLGPGGFSDLFHTPDGDAYACVPVNGHPANLAVRSPEFRDWLVREFYMGYSQPPSRREVNKVLDLLEAEARYGGPSSLVYVRIGDDRGGRIYIDIGNDGWEVVEITGDGWRVIQDSQVRFRRTLGMAALPKPVPGGRIADLRPFRNVGTDGDRADRDFVLLVSWLVAACRSLGPYPILILEGEPGAAKSTTSRILRRMIDPSAVAVRSMPRSERDLVIAAADSWVLAFDNASRIRPEMSDALCRVATGGGFGTRRLYTDRGQF